MAAPATSLAVDPSTIEAILFDFDGTLVDASEAIVRSFHAALAAADLAPLEPARIRAMVGRPLREMFEVAAPAATAPELDTLVEGYRAAFGPLAVPLSRPLPSVPEALDRLARGRRLAVVTSRASAGASLILEAMGLAPLFEVVVGLEAVERPKPDPEAVLRALALLDVAPGRALMVGDTPDDVRAGLAAGTATAGVTTGWFDGPALRAAGAGTVIARLDELAELLEPAGGAVPAG